MLFLLALSLASALAAPSTCVDLRIAGKGNAIDDGAAIVDLDGTVSNRCPTAVLAYRGYLRVTSTASDQTLILPVYAHEAKLNGSARREQHWRFSVGASPVELWLYAVPPETLVWEWSPEVTILADGTVLVETPAFSSAIPSHRRRVYRGGDVATDAGPAPVLIIED